MPNKNLHSFRLSEAAENYLQEYAAQNGGNLTLALDKIIMEHKQYYNGLLEAISDKVMEKFNDKYENLFTRVRLGANGADKNTQIILEVLNTMLFYSDAKEMEVTSTDVIKSPVLSGAEETVKKRIEGYRVKKLEKEKQRYHREK